MAVLLSCWCVALVVLGAVILKAMTGWWLLAAAVLTLLPLAAAGRALAEPFVKHLGYRESVLITDAVGSFFTVAVATLLGAAIVTGVAGPQVYHAYAGERAEAVISDTKPEEDEDGERTGTRYRVVDFATEEDLGWLARGPKERATPGELIEISVDPHGRVAPVAADRLGWTTTPTTLLVACLAATTLAALAVVVRALQAWADADATATGASRRGRVAVRRAGPGPR
jgi:hypothetical protein